MPGAPVDDRDMTPQDFDCGVTAPSPGLRATHARARPASAQRGSRITQRAARMITAPIRAVAAAFFLTALPACAPGSSAQLYSTLLQDNRPRTPFEIAPR